VTAHEERQEAHFADLVEPIDRRLETLRAAIADLEAQVDRVEKARSVLLGGDYEPPEPPASESSPPQRPAPAASRPASARGGAATKGVKRGAVSARALELVRQAGDAGLNAVELAERTGAKRTAAGETLKRLYRDEKIARSGAGTTDDPYRFYPLPGDAVDEIGRRVPRAEDPLGAKVEEIGRLEREALRPRRDPRRPSPP
jgi:hypothetical protein